MRKKEDREHEWERAKGKTAARENIPTANKNFTAGSSPKQKNYQTNPFWNPHPAYSHKDLQQMRINPAAKTNPFGPPVRSMPVLRRLGEGGFNVSLPSLCLCGKTISEPGKSNPIKPNQTQKKFLFRFPGTLASEITPSPKLPSPSP
jgi:hypothetical protein